MPSSQNQTPGVLTSQPTPTVADIDRIAALANPVIRNLLITQCYCEVSAAFADRTGLGANWCTFATWASKQAGQTIRQEDLMRTLEAMLKKELEIEQALSLIASLAQQMGAKQSFENIKHTTLISIIETAAGRASEAVSRGNKKVFEEIAREFARFIAECLQDTSYTVGHIEEFCRLLRPGPPPEGQEYLKRGFTRYYVSLFETDPKKRAESRFLANLEIGFHEQNRLQPEIAESLNTAAAVDPQKVKSRLLSILFPGDDGGHLGSIFKSFLSKTDLLDNAITMLVSRVQHHLRLVLTAHLMTLTVPPDNRLHLGHDLVAVYPAHLQQLADQDLLSLLAKIDPTPDSLLQSGAADWADLPERMHYITELFRCYHETESLFDSAFSVEQLAELRNGKIPEGPL